MTAQNTSNPQGWTAVACSADGTKIIAAAGEAIESDQTVGPGLIYTSSDSGVTWAAQNTNDLDYWGSVASSADGTVLLAAPGYGDQQIGQAVVSTDSGATWKDFGFSDPNPDGYSYGYAVSAMSADGNTMILGSSGAPFGQTPLSYNKGGFVNWDNLEHVADDWIAAAMTADGSKIVMVGYSYPNYVAYTSMNYGGVWVQQTSVPNVNLVSVASSADGSLLVAAARGGEIYTSTDFGATWTARTSDRQQWVSVATSADGTKLYAATTSGAIYTSVPTPPYTGAAGTTAQFQYVGNGMWQPVQTSASQIAGTLTPAQLPGNVLTNNESGVTLGGTFNGTFAGAGANLTSLNANNLNAGTVPLARLPAQVVMNNASGVTLNGSFSGTISGNGSGLTNLPANPNFSGNVLGGQFYSVGGLAEYNFWDRNGTNTFGQWSLFAANGRVELWNSISSQNKFSVDTNGNVRAQGTFTASTSPDLAETIAAADNVEAGDIVCADPQRPESVMRCGRNDRGVLGVISDGTGGFLINANARSTEAPLTGKPLVLVGRVPVKVSCEDGPVHIGDYLTPSSLPGVAMKAGNANAGTVVGVALENFDASQPGKVLCFVKVGDGAAAGQIADLRRQLNEVRTALREVQQQLSRRGAE